jgi:GT2 family glycosyltransferase
VATVSIVVPTFRREEVLVDSLNSLVGLLKAGDEIIVIDQTLEHEKATIDTLDRLSASGLIRWYRRTHPSQNEAMNIAALLASGDILVFLDDDIVPTVGLLEGHRTVLSDTEGPPATCGQVLQPWHVATIESVKGFDLEFDPAYSEPCNVRFLIGANFAIRRETYLQIGGMDENFNGANYRNDTEMAYRICARTGKPIRFVPDASLRHLFAGGGNRAFGAKDTWGHIGGSIGDYYFAMKCLPRGEMVRHVLRRIVRAPLNRNTLRHPWLIPSLAVREIVAFFRACSRLAFRPHKGIRPLEDYGVLREPKTYAVQDRE